MSKYSSFYGYDKVVLCLHAQLRKVDIKCELDNVIRNEVKKNTTRPIATHGYKICAKLH